MTERLRTYMTRMMPAYKFQDYRIVRLTGVTLPADQCQTDGHSCGFFMIAKMLSVVQGGNAYTRIYQSKMPEIREMLGSLIYNFAVKVL